MTEQEKFEYARNAILEHLKSMSHERLIDGITTTEHLLDRLKLDGYVNFYVVSTQNHSITVSIPTVDGNSMLELSVGPLERNGNL